MRGGIPDESRRIVEKRDLWLCARCGVRGSDWHHRRSRRVRGIHQHCACNGVILCRNCHDYAHKHPHVAISVGLIVSQWEERPWMVPIRRTNGWWLLRCAGMGIQLQPSDVDAAPFLSPYEPGKAEPPLLHVAKAEALGIVDPQMQVW